MSIVQNDENLFEDKGKHIKDEYWTIKEYKQQKKKNKKP